MFILINTLALGFICYAYVRMINEIRASGVACRSTRQSQDRDKVAQRFGIIVFTDSLCWVPVIVVKILALSGTNRKLNKTICLKYYCSPGVIIPQDLYAWLAIFVLPINSALNPVLYTLTTTIFKKQVRYSYNFFSIRLMSGCFIGEEDFSFLLAQKTIRSPPFGFRLWI